MKATITYLLIYLEEIAMLISIMLGIGATESSSWWKACLFIFGPFIYGKLVRFDDHVKFQETFSKNLKSKMLKKV